MFCLRFSFCFVLFFSFARVQSGSLTDLSRRKQCCNEDNVNARSVYRFISTKSLLYWLDPWPFMCTIFGFSLFVSFCLEFVHFFFLYNYSNDYLSSVV